MLLAKVLLVFLTFSITVEGSLFCMTDCNSPFREPSLYEQVCCNQNNTGKTFKQRVDKTVTIILCPLTIPDSCQQQGKQINRILITDEGGHHWELNTGSLDLTTSAQTTKPRQPDNY